MVFRIKDWGKFQHFKDRTPPWVKLYRDILDDPDWHELDGQSAKVLTMLWLIASEDETHFGILPCTRKLAFRLRLEESKVKQILDKLSHWLIQDDINTISERYQVDAPETETETERETKKETETDDGFDEFWRIYDYAKGKPAAKKSWKKLRPSIELQLSIYDAARAYVQSTPDKQFRKHASTWLNAEGWNDEIVVKQQERKVGFFGTVMNFGDSQNEQLPIAIASRLDG